MVEKPMLTMTAGRAMGGGGRDETGGPVRGGGGEGGGGRAADCVCNAGYSYVLAPPGVGPAGPVLPAGAAAEACAGNGSVLGAQSGRLCRLNYGRNEDLW